MGVQSVIVRTLGSGSSGNAIVIQANGSSILVDCGLGVRELVAGLSACGLRLRDLDAVLLTHEHADHVRSLPLVVKAGVQVLTTTGTARSLGLPSDTCRTIEPSSETIAGGLRVTAVPVSHDAAEPCGFTIESGVTRATLMTDLGCADDSLLGVLAASDLIVLEANHDLGMLRRGPYPQRLKARIRSSTGHLSNADCGRLLRAALLDVDRTRTIWLAHLSATNNLPSVAVQTVAAALDGLPSRHVLVALPAAAHPSAGSPGWPRQ